MQVIKNKFMVMVINMAKPMIKNFLKAEIRNNQALVIQTIKNKIDVPKLTPEEETKLYTDIYDALEVSADIIIDRI